MTSGSERSTGPPWSTGVFADVGVVAWVPNHRVSRQLARAVSEAAWPGVQEVVPGERSVTLVLDPLAASSADVADALSHLPPASDSLASPRLFELPVVLDGPDLDEVARLSGIPPGELAGTLEGTTLEVAFLGFAPGFAYLVGLPERLARVPRRATPRSVVPRGSFALAGGFAAIYPEATPGGWQLVGRTDVALFDAFSPPYALLAPGDLVRLRCVHHQQAGPRSITGETESPGLDPVTIETAYATHHARRQALRSASKRSAVVIDPGFLTTVQDAGRIGLAHIGVPRAGPADPLMARAANRLVGNLDFDALLEVTARGPAMEFRSRAHVAFVGAGDLLLAGRRLPAGVTLTVEPGEILEIPAVHAGVRGYLAVSGGFDTPRILSSHSSDTLAGLGIGPLIFGDELGLGPGHRPRGHLGASFGQARPTSVLRVVAGPEPIGGRGIGFLTSRTWKVSGTSSRVGIRLSSSAPGEFPGLPQLPGASSVGVVTGVVQLPPDGCPIILACDHATHGGYPVLATVTSADHGILGQLLPGDEVRFDQVDLAEAHRALTCLERSLARAVSGWLPEGLA